jgi:hypothetical protein
MCNRTLDIEADTVYNAVVKFERVYQKELTIDSFKGKVNVFFDITGNILIDLVTKPATRELTIVGENGTICWNVNLPSVWYEDTKGNGTSYEVESGIPESIYVEETQDFINGQHKYSQKEELQVIKMLREVETCEV